MQKKTGPSGPGFTEADAQLRSARDGRELRLDDEDDLSLIDGRGRWPVVQPVLAVPVEREPDVPVPVPLLCAYDTPITATIDAMAAARVKRLGNLLMWILL